MAYPDERVGRARTVVIRHCLPGSPVDNDPLGRRSQAIGSWVIISASCPSERS